MKKKIIKERVLKNGVRAGYVLQKDGSYRFRFLKNKKNKKKRKLKKKIMKGGNKGYYKALDIWYKNIINGNEGNRYLDMQIKESEDCNRSFIAGNVFSDQGGHSQLFYLKDIDNFLLRIIPYENWKNEIKISLLVSSFVVNRICPNFPMTVAIKFSSEYKNTFQQIIEKMDGDVEDLWDEIKKVENDHLKNIFVFQILIALYCLYKNKIVHGDLKKKNIVYKKLDNPVIITYILQGKQYDIITNYIFYITDFGVSKNMIQNKSDKVADIISIASIYLKGSITMKLDRTVSRELKNILFPEVNMPNTRPKNFINYLSKNYENILLKLINNFYFKINNSIQNSQTTYLSIITLIPSIRYNREVYNLDNNIQDLDYNKINSIMENLESCFNKKKTR